MPAQKRKDLASDGDDEEKRADEEVKEEIAKGEVKEEGGEEKEEIKEEKEEKEEEDKVPEEKVADPQVKEEDSDADGNSQSSNSAGDGDEFVLVKLAEVRKEVQCPICLGIIRKTRTVMECLHRFCRDCIDKSMRLSNNECPACRTHCASRRSLRDDPNFDALISALYPDIDKYEEEELAFCEEERNRNQKIQETIAETFRRQTEALGKKKSQRARFPRRRARGRGRSNGPHLVINEGSEDDQDMNINGDEGGGRDKDSSFSEDDDVALVSSADVVARPKKRARRSSKTGNSEDAGEDNEDPMTGVSSPSPSKAPKEKEKETGVSSSSPFKPGNKDLPGASSSPLKASSKELTGVSLSPLRTGNMEVLSWGKNGTRSSLAGRLVKNPRVSKLIEHLRNIDDNNNNNERDMHVSLVPLNGESMPGLEMLYICCKQNISIQQLCQFVAVNLSQKAEDIEIYAKRPNIGYLENEGFINDMSKLEILQPEKSISELKGNLELIYGLKVKN